MAFPRCRPPDLGFNPLSGFPRPDVSNSALDNYLDSVATELSTAGLYTPNATSLINAAINAADDFVPSPRPDRWTLRPGNTRPAALRGHRPFRPVCRRRHARRHRTIPGHRLRVHRDRPCRHRHAHQAARRHAAADGLDGSFYQFNSSDYLAYYQTAGGLQTTFNYDANHNVTSVVAPGNQVTTYTYNSNGLVTSSTDPFGNVTTYGYTVSNSVPLLTSITTPAGTTTITYTPTPAVIIAGGTPPEPSGDPGGGSPGSPGHTYYTSSPALEYLPTSITLPDGSGEEYTYDGFGRLTKTTLLDGSDPVTQTYDATGLGVTTTFADGTTETYLLGPSGIPLKTTDATGNTTSFSYGPNLLLSSILAPGGAQSSLTYNSQNQLSGGVSPTGKRSHLTYDSEGRVIGIDRRQRQHRHRGLRFQLQPDIPDVPGWHADSIRL